jgi:hypothetical protein
MYRLYIALHLQDHEMSPRASQGTSQAGMTQLDTATQNADWVMVCEMSRREHLLHILPPDIVHALPGPGEVFTLECISGQQYTLAKHAIPLLCQILSLEYERKVRAVRLIHQDGCREWIYCL